MFAVSAAKVSYPLRHRRSLTITIDEGRGLEISNDDSYGSRVVITDFDVIVTPTPFSFTQSDLNALHSTLEAVVWNQIQSKQEEFPYGTTLQDVLLGNIISIPEEEDVTRLKFSGGRVNFGGSSTPSVGDVNGWVKYAVDNYYVTALQNTQFYYIESSTHLMDGQSYVPPAPIVQEPSTSPQGSSTNNAGAIAGSIIAVAVVCLLAAMFLVHRRSRRMSNYMEQHNPSKEHLDGLAFAEDDEGEGATALNVSVDSLTPRKTPLSPVVAVPDDGKSIAGSESDFTVNTEAGDSAAIKSLAPGAYTAVSASRVATESFERERPVNLRKDMLTSSWSAGRVFGLGPLRTNQNESVLAPSHFSASEERQVRMQMHGNDEGSNNSENSKDSLVFEQANEEKEGGVVLMPPSQTNKRRRTGEIV